MLLASYYFIICYPIGILKKNNMQILKQYKDMTYQMDGSGIKIRELEFSGLVNRIHRLLIYSFSYLFPRL